MKTLLISTAMIVAATGASAGRYIDQCTTRNVPYTTTETYKSGGSTGDALAGAIIGGVIGNQFGNGNGKDAATVLGAIIGAHEAEKPRTRTRTVTRYTQKRVCNRVWQSSAVQEHRIESMIHRANRGKLPMEQIKDLQYTLGIKDDGVWGRNSRRAGQAYLNEINYVEPLIYGLSFNGNVLTSSQDLKELRRIQRVFEGQGIKTNIVAQ